MILATLPLTQSRELKRKSEPLDDPTRGDHALPRGDDWHLEVEERLATFSKDETGAFRPNDEQKRYYMELNKDQLASHISLAEGFKDWIKKPEKEDPLDNIYKALFHCENRSPDSPANSLDAVSAVGLPEAVKDVDIVSWRGLFTKIMCTPYLNRDAWAIRVHIRPRPTPLVSPPSSSSSSSASPPFILEFTECKEKAFLAQFNGHKKPSFTCPEGPLYYGRKFEGLVTLDADTFEAWQALGQPSDAFFRLRKDTVVNENQEWVHVVRTKLAAAPDGRAWRCILGAEVDAACAKDGRTLVEFKTTSIIKHQKQERTLKALKYIKWWGQSALVGIERLVVGMRRDEILEHVIEHRVSELPSLCYLTSDTSKSPLWDSTVCLAFLDRVLSFVSDYVTGQGISEAKYVLIYDEPFECIRLVEDA